MAEKKDPKSIMCLSCKIGHLGPCKKRPPKHIVFCGECLVTKLHPQDRAKSEPPRSLSLLHVQKVQLTGEWCYRCGSPTCAQHGTRDTAGGWLCAQDDCRDRSLPLVEEFREALDIYSDGWRTVGPKRCHVCGLPLGPGYGKGLCHRHYSAWKKGRPLYLENNFTYRGLQKEWIRIGIPYHQKESFEELATDAGLGLSAWLHKAAEAYAIQELAKKGKTIPEYRPPVKTPVLPTPPPKDNGKARF